MVKRTTIELDEQLLARARRALGQVSTRATVEEALRRAADAADRASRERADQQLRYLHRLHRHVDCDVLLSEDMWR
ncbi:MAG: type II toxin-antitoxin system VapB family antitoxin [Acidimicrobiia bacterium]|nr:type II toxin-antitoxin system VapB family antitoxin [Acidimicrobiia bacterium]